jgi:hypothetical protein
VADDDLDDVRTESQKKRTIFWLAAHGRWP